MKYYLMTFCMGLIMGGLIMYLYQKKDPKEEVTRNLKKGESKISVVKGKETKKEKWVEKTSAAMLSTPVDSPDTTCSMYKFFAKDSSYAEDIKITTYPKTDSINVLSSVKVREVEKMRVDTVLVSRVDTLETVRTIEKPDPKAFKTGFLAGVTVSAVAATIIIILL